VDTATVFTCDTVHRHRWLILSTTILGLVLGGAIRIVFIGTGILFFLLVKLTA
jgi:hypothetical protein